jgi:hypothetical protein
MDTFFLWHEGILPMASFRKPSKVESVVAVFYCPYFRIPPDFTFHLIKRLSSFGLFFISSLYHFMLAGTITKLCLYVFLLFVMMREGYCFWYLFFEMVVLVHTFSFFLLHTILTTFNPFWSDSIRLDCI